MSKIISILLGLVLGGLALGQAPATIVPFEILDGENAVHAELLKGTTSDVVWVAGFAGNATWSSFSGAETDTEWHYQNLASGSLWRSVDVWNEFGDDVVASGEGDFTYFAGHFFAAFTNTTFEFEDPKSTNGVGFRERTVTNTVTIRSQVKFLKRTLGSFRCAGSTNTYDDYLVTFDYFPLSPQGVRGVKASLALARSVSRWQESDFTSDLAALGNVVVCGVHVTTSEGEKALAEDARFWEPPRVHVLEMDPPEFRPIHPHGL